MLHVSTTTRGIRGTDVDTRQIGDMLKNGIDAPPPARPRRDTHNPAARVSLAGFRHLAPNGDAGCGKEGGGARRHGGDGGGRPPSNRDFGGVVIMRRRYCRRRRGAKEGQRSRATTAKTTLAETKTATRTMRSAAATKDRERLIGGTRQPTSDSTQRVGRWECEEIWWGRLLRWQHRLLAAPCLPLTTYTSTYTSTQCQLKQALKYYPPGHLIL
jgi:hypothetical protein